MRAASAFPPPPTGRTFPIAIAVLSALAVAQIFAVLVIFAARTRTAREAGRPALTASSRPMVPVETPRPQPTATPVPTVAAPVVLSTPASLRPPPPAATPSARARLLAEAKALRANGDTTNALAKLQEAASIDPKNAELLAEMALTYESMRLTDRSNETWKRVEDLGPSAGPLYELAQLKLRIGTAPTTATSGGMAGASPMDAGASPGDADGIPDGSTFGIAEAKPTEETDPAAETKLTLRVAVKARPNTPIDHTKVKIQVFFYDIVDDDQVVLTDADVSYQWVTPRHNWTDTNTEILDVTYLRAKKESTPEPSATPEAAPSSPAPTDSPKGKKKGKGKRNDPILPIASDAQGLPTRESANRKYLGYIVRVYYKEQLQAVRADPTKLLNLFPPPFTAPPAQ